jgi:hypothetical protein
MAGEAAMSKSNWVVIWVLLAVGVGAAVMADKGSWLNAVVTGQCNACPAPRQCQGNHRIGRGYVPSVDGCHPPWWQRRL